MNLFNEKIINLLDKDGISNYYGKIISKKESDRFYELLLKNIFWKNDEAVIYGKRITTKRKVAWYAILIILIQIHPNKRYHGL